MFKLIFSTFFSVVLLAISLASLASANGDMTLHGMLNVVVNGYREIYGITFDSFQKLFSFLDIEYDFQERERLSVMFLMGMPFVLERNASKLSKVGILGGFALLFFLYGFTEDVGLNESWWKILCKVYITIAIMTLIDKRQFSWLPSSIFSEDGRPVILGGIIASKNIVGAVLLLAMLIASGLMSFVG